MRHRKCLQVVIDTLQVEPLATCETNRQCLQVVIDTLQVEPLATCETNRQCLQVVIDTLQSGDGVDTNIIDDDVQQVRGTHTRGCFTATK